jgi:hypothetical protein
MNLDEGDSKKENRNNMFDAGNVLQPYGLRCVNENAVGWWDVILEHNLIVLPIIGLFFWSILLFF